MPSAPDLHQIEYRHHQTRDLSPAASSMASREALAAWDSRIRSWVRHPHADFLSESACYQTLPNDQAALAWRYWSKQAAYREDGTHGRPLVSRVLVGPVSVLTPEVAIAAGRAGLSADWAGPLPGKVPDDSGLPMVSGAALSALAREMSPELDAAAIAHQGLPAVVAAALAEPSIPLAISLQDLLIQAPLRECVQFPLLWGLRRVTGRLLGPDERGWSFSTFELPLGEMDPASLPAIVFREAKDGVKAPPARWRREVKVRPFEAGAMDDGTPYAGQLALAGALVAAYRERGGDWLEQLITERGGQGPFEARVERVADVVLKPRRRPGRHGARPPAGPDREPPGRQEASNIRPAPREPAPAGHTVDSLPVADLGPADPPEGRLPARAEALDTREAGAPQAGVMAPGATVPGVTGPGRMQPGVTHPGVVPPGVVPAGGAEPGSPPAAAMQAQPAAPDGAWWPAAGPTGSPRSSEPPTVRTSAAELAAHGQVPSRAGSGPADGQDRQVGASRQGQVAPPLQLPGQPGQPRLPASASPPPRAQQGQPRGGQQPVSALLKALELLEEDQERFELILDGIYRAAGGMSAEERERSWEVISGIGWYENICRNNSFRSEDLAALFTIIVIPELAEPWLAQVIARWALEAPVPMVAGLLAAAQRVSPAAWNAMMDILEPALAYRWTDERFMRDQWDASRAVRPSADPRRGDGKGGFLGMRRRRG